MKINSIGAMSYNRTARSVKSMTQTFDDVQKKVHHHKGGTMRALAAAAAISMASLGLTGCPQPIDPTPIEIPAEDPATEDPAVEDPATEDPAVEDPTTEDPAAEDPTTEDPAVEDPTVETPTIDIANTPIVKAIKEMGFGIDVVEVAPVEGLYTPEPGDLIDLKFEDLDVDWDIHMQLDRENSTKDNLVYKWVSCWNMVYDEDVPVEKRDNYISKMTVDKENYSVTFSYYYNNKEWHTMTCRIALDENNKPSFIYNGYVNGHIDTVQAIQDGEVFKPPGITQYSNIEIQLAK